MSEVSELKKQRQNDSENNRGKITLVEDLQSELHTLRAGLENAVKAEDLHVENKKWKSRVMEMQTIITTLKQQNDDCKEDRDAANDQLARQISMNKNLQSDVAIAQQAISNAQEANRALKSEQKALKQKHNQTVDRSESDANSNRNALKRKEAECSQLAVAMDQVKQSEMMMEKKYRTLKKRLEDSELMSNQVSRKK